MTHENCLDILKKAFEGIGLKNKNNVFYLDLINIVAIIKYRKHTIQNGFFLDTGLMFKSLDSSMSFSREKSWHLFGSYGAFSSTFQKTIYIDEINESEFLTIKDELVSSLKGKWFPFINSIDNLHYLKKIYPDNFDFTIMEPLGMENYNRIKFFLDNSCPASPSMPK